MAKKLETVYVDFGDTSVQATIERLVELVGIEAVKYAVDEIAAQQMREPDAPKSAPVCTCSMDDGIHEWNCALEKARR